MQNLSNSDFPIKDSNFNPSVSLKKRYLILALIILPALLLRLYKLDEGLWYDEILTHVRYATRSFGDIITTFDSQNQNFLYSILAHSSYLIFGESGWSLRLPAVVFGVASIWATYLVGRQVSNTQEALLSAALLTFSYHHIWFSQNARGYTGLLFWTLLSSWLLIKGLSNSRTSIWVLYALSAALGIYTQVAMIFVVIGHFIIYVWRIISSPNKRWKDWTTSFLFGFCLAGSITIALYAIALPQVLNALTSGASGGLKVWSNPQWTIIEMARAMKMSFGSVMAAVIALFVFLLGFLSYARKNPILILLLTIPALTFALVLNLTGHNLWPRLFFFTIGFAAIILVRGVVELGIKFSDSVGLGTRKTKILCTLMVIAVIVVSATSISAVFAPKQDFEGALKFVEQSREPGDAVVTVGLANYPYTQFYDVDWIAVDDIETLRAIMATSERIWLLYTLPKYLEEVHPEMYDMIHGEFNVVKEFHGTLRDGKIVVCKSESPSL